jgi:hypothetical protein
MRNILLTHENGCKAASFAPWWCQQVQGRTLAAAVALVSMFIAAPLSLWNSAKFQSSNATTITAQAKGSALSSEVLARASEPAIARAITISSTSIDRLCSEILASAWRGEPLSEQSRAFLQKECQ